MVDTRSKSHRSCVTSINAPGNSTTTFTIPANLIFGATPLRFLADPIGSNRTPVSDEITVQPGDQVRLVLPPR